MKDGSKKIAESHFCRLSKRIEQDSLPKISLKRYLPLWIDGWKKYFIRRYDAFVVLTKDEKVRYTDAKAKMVEAIPNPLAFYPEEVPFNNAKQVISVGKLAYRKGIYLLIKAWAKVSRVYPDWKLDIYSDDGDEEALEKAIKAEGLDESLSVHSDSDVRIRQEYAGYSLFVMPSLYDGVGLVVAEAMAYGLPCISFDYPGCISEIVRNGEDGLLVEARNVDKLADAIVFLIKDKDLRQEMSENARENVKQFLPDKIMPRWIALFQQLTETSGY
jgi:glycosyltransferase involved in cell wall biosynthesis